MTVRAVTLDDVDWVVEVLSVRRAALAQHAPVFWRPAPDASQAHRAHLRRLLAEPGTLGFRTACSVLIAAATTTGFIIDDAYVPDQRWTTDPDAAELWDALGDAAATSPVRMVCPTYEAERGPFALERGLLLEETWWLLELPASADGQPGVRIDLPGASAITVAAPPVYAPPGPILFLPDVVDPGVAIAAAVAASPRLGCAGVVVSQSDEDPALESELRRAGFRRHCEYCEGEL